MYRTWTASARDAQSLARALEIHLNEFAETVLSVSSAVDDAHHVLVVYEPIEPSAIAADETAVEVAEKIIDSAPS